MVGFDVGEMARASRQKALPDCPVEPKHGAAMIRQRFEILADHFVVLLYCCEKDAEALSTLAEAALLLVADSTDGRQDPAIVLLEELTGDGVFGGGTVHFVNHLIPQLHVGAGVIDAQLKRGQIRPRLKGEGAAQRESIRLLGRDRQQKSQLAPRLKQVRLRVAEGDLGLGSLSSFLRCLLALIGPSAGGLDDRVEP